MKIIVITTVAIISLSIAIGVLIYIFYRRSMTKFRNNLSEGDNVYHFKYRSLVFIRYEGEYHAWCKDSLGDRYLIPLYKIWKD